MLDNGPGKATILGQVVQVSITTTEREHLNFLLKLVSKSIVSIHDQLVAYFSVEIQCRRMIQGEALPSENALAKELGISRMIVRRAFDNLVFAGLLARRQGNVSLP